MNSCLCNRKEATIEGIAQGGIVTATMNIEVSKVDSHVNLKVVSWRQTKLMVKMVLGLQNLRLTILHLNMTILAQMIFLSFSLKVDDMHLDTYTAL